MQILSIFPFLFTFEIIGPFLIRIAVSIFLIYLGKKRYDSELKWPSAFYIITGVLVFLGLYTQIAVLVGIAVLKFDFYFYFWKNRGLAPVQKETYFLYSLAIAILLSLLLTGPGFLAFDWPL